jgi:short-subunit dehydrogenase
MSEWKNKTALITGASYGLGEAFAEELAAAGATLILTARSHDRLEMLADRLRNLHKVAVSIITADLGDPNGAEKIFRETEARQLTVDLLINNAGFGTVGDFVDQPLARQLEMIQLNVSSLVSLTHLYLPAMLARRSGAIMQVASTAAFQGVPYFAIYGGTKAFVLNFSEALRVECAPNNVRILTLCPGPTATHFQTVAGTADRGSAEKMQSPVEVVRVGLEALSTGRSHVVSGLNNKIMVIAERLLPRALITSVAGRLYRPFSKRSANQ